MQINHLEETVIVFSGDDIGECDRAIWVRKDWYDEHNGEECASADHWKVENRRMLHVLACPRPECTAKPEGWVAIRSQAADAATSAAGGAGQTQDVMEMLASVESPAAPAPSPLDDEEQPQRKPINTNEVALAGGAAAARGAGSAPPRKLQTFPKDSPFSDPECVTIVTARGWDDFPYHTYPLGDGY